MVSRGKQTCRILKEIQKQIAESTSFSCAGIKLIAWVLM